MRGRRGWVSHGCWGIWNPRNGKEELVGVEWSGVEGRRWEWRVGRENGSEENLKGKINWLSGEVTS